MLKAYPAIGYRIIKSWLGECGAELPWDAGKKDQDQFA
jgi:hypothetical protein